MSSIWMRKAMNPTIRTIEGIETLADAIAAAGLNK